MSRDDVGYQRLGYVVMRPSRREDAHFTDREYLHGTEMERWEEDSSTSTRWSLDQGGHAEAIARDIRQRSGAYAVHALLVRGVEKATAPVTERKKRSPRYGT